ncbi:MAG: hypothetical protein M3094_02665 [Actinomycetia bacterium]|nr:hypothetical protein [Actinomycetes bacterium]
MHINGTTVEATAMDLLFEASSDLHQDGFELSQEITSGASGPEGSKHLRKARKELDELSAALGHIDKAIHELMAIGYNYSPPQF